jgi:hypothetical protein
MLALVAVPAIYLAALQAVINVPRDAFRNCLKESSAKASTEKVAANAYEAWVRNTCAGQLTTLRNAIVGFNVKNGMPRKDAASDADLTVDDYLASSVDKYKFLAGVDAENAKAQASATAPAVTPPAQATPASASQPPK